MLSERDYTISPLVPDSIAHNAKTLNHIHSLTSPLLGLAAGILGLESYPGFIFYLLGTLFVSGLIHFLLAEGRPDRYFRSVGTDLWGAEILGGLSGFVLAWTGGFGIGRS